MESKRQWMATNRPKTIKLFRSLFPGNNGLAKTIGSHMREHGYDESQPIILWDRSEGEGRNALYVVDGHTRLVAAKQVGLSPVGAYTIYTCPVPILEEDILEYFVCEIIKPIKRRCSRTALNKNKSMNKVLSGHTCIDQCLYQFLRDGQCYNGQNPYACEEFKQRSDGIDLGQISLKLRNKLKDSIALKYREMAEQNKVTISTDTEEVFTKQILFPPMDEERKRISSAGVVSYVWFDPKTDSVTKTKRIKVETHGTQLNQVAVGGGWVDSTHKGAPKSLCTKCGSWVQYPHDPKKVTVKCWLCVTKEVLAYENKKPEQNIKTKEPKPNGKRTSIPKRKKAGRRNSRR